MVAFFKRPAAEDGLDARIAVLSRRAQPLANPPDPVPAPVPPVTSDNRRARAPEITGSTVPDIAPVAVPDIDPRAAPTPLPTAISPPNLSEEDRFLLACEELLTRLAGELSPERISILSRGELAKVVDAAVQAHFVRNGVEPDPIVRRDLITALIKGLLEPQNTQAGADDGSSRRSNRSAVESAKAQIQPLVLEHMDVAAAAEMPRAVFEAQLSGWVKDLLTETKIQLNFIEQHALVESLIADMLGLGPLEPLIEDETVTDIMVNGARQVYVERRGKLELTGVRFRDDDQDRVADRPAHRRGQAAGRCPSRRRQPRQHHHPAARDRRAGDLDP